MKMEWFYLKGGFEQTPSGSATVYSKEDADQTGLISRLICTFSVRTLHGVNSSIHAAGTRQLYRVP